MVDHFKVMGISSQIFGAAIEKAPARVKLSLRKKKKRVMPMIWPCWRSLRPTWQWWEPSPSADRMWCLLYTRSVSQSNWWSFERSHPAETPPPSGHTSRCHYPAAIKVMYVLYLIWIMKYLTVEVLLMFHDLITMTIFSSVMLKFPPQLI